VTKRDVARAEIEGQLGKVTRLEIDPIPALLAQRFAVACGDMDDVFFDLSAARAAGWSSIPLPPLFLSSVRSWTAGPVDLSADGTPRHDVGYPSSGAMRVIGGGQRLEFESEAVVDQPLVTEAEVVDVRAKAGRTGELLLVEVERRFFAADGALLVRCHETRVLR
jgi:hypothetical protein